MQSHYQSSQINVVTWKVLTHVPADHLVAGIKEWGHEWVILLKSLLFLWAKVIVLDHWFVEIGLTGFSEENMLFQLSQEE